MKLLNRDVVGSDSHRSGWPVVMQNLRLLANGDGLLLDDFADASFTYKGVAGPHPPWVGVFHHPATIHSPLASDNRHRLLAWQSHRYWPASQYTLRGAIGLCREVAQYCCSKLAVPALALLHPTDTTAQAWDAEAALENRNLIQVGFFLRNLNAIYQIAPDGWRRTYLRHPKHAYRERDIRQLQTPVLNPQEVTTAAYLSHDAYDQALATSVVLSEFYGAAANNLVVECMVRGTPLLCNRLPAIEEYVGADYPLFFERLSDASRLLTPSRLRDASEHLRERATILPSFAEFAANVTSFVESL